MTKGMLFLRLQTFGVRAVLQLLLNIEHGNRLLLPNIDRGNRLLLRTDNIDRGNRLLLPTVLPDIRGTDRRSVSLMPSGVQGNVKARTTLN